MTFPQATPILELSNVSRNFGGIRAVDNVSFQLDAGEIVGLIGPNGAGKTTLVDLISGFNRVSGGTIRYDGRDLGGDKPHQIAALGVARTFQIVQPFSRMTVLENVMAGALFAGRNSMVRARAIAMDCLDFVKLAPFAAMPAAELALANRKRLELAKSLAMSPRILMLDEVNAGLNSSEIDEAIQMIRAIAARGVTIIVIEHLMRVVVALASRTLVLHQGGLVREGPTGEVLRDPKVVEAYLGSRFAARLSAEGSSTGAPD